MARYNSVPFCFDNITEIENAFEGVATVYKQFCHSRHYDNSFNLTQTDAFEKQNPRASNIFFKILIIGALVGSIQFSALLF